MNRALALVLSFGVVASACRKAEPKHERAPAKVEAPRNATVRPISASVGSRVAIADVGDRRSAIVSDEDDRAIVLVDIEKQSITSRASFAGSIGQLLVAPNGTIYAAIRGAAKVVALRIREDGAIVEHASAETGHEPWGLALSPDGSDLFVTSIGDARLEAFAASDLAPRTKVDLPRDPRSVITLDGKRLFVSHAVGSVMSIVDVPHGEALGAPRAIALAASERRRDFGQEIIFKPMAPIDDDGPWGGLRKIPPPPKAFVTMKRAATQGFALAAVNGQVFAPETLVLTDDANRIPSGYGSVEQSTLSTHVPFIARIDAAKGELVNHDFSGPDDRLCFEKKASCLLPRAAAESDGMLFVACADEGVIAFDTARDYEHAPACKDAFKERRRLDIDSPNAIAIDPKEKTLIAFSDVTRKLTFARAKGWSETTSIELPRHEPAPSALAIEGRRLFHTSGDDRISRNGRACASCHPEGRDDALVWPTPKGKRQTPMLAGRVVGTEPYDWNGAHASLEIHITSTLKNLDGKGLPNEQLSALAAYVKSLEPPARRAKSNEAIAHGGAIFRSSEAGCASCHVETMRLTDSATHPIGNGKEQFDTPSLAFVGMTAPYFHDGRYASLEELVDKCDGVMGHTSHLSRDERKDLVAFLRSL